MEFYRATLETCAQAQGLVVVIDVLRAFSTAAYAFAAGANRILLAGTVEEAFELRARRPYVLVMGEVEGLPVLGFDFSNSPSDVAGEDLAGRTLVQRTSSGTQGVLRSRAAEAILASSFVVAGATARRILAAAPESVTFVITGQRPDGRGEEDAACADYIEAVLRGAAPDPEPYLARARHSTTGRVFADPARPDFPARDLEDCLALDRFDFALAVRQEEGLFVLERG